MPLAKVNLGCGSRAHPDWLNYDLTPVLPGVRKVNFITGVPLADSSASVVYHSHVLEHLPRELAVTFLTECKRVLAPGGILRIVVPDLEQIARDYVAVLDRRRTGEDTAAARSDHRWMIIEMVDQLVRTRPGGELTRVANRGTENDAFIAPRLGEFGRHWFDTRDRRAADPPAKRSRFQRLLDALERWMPGTWGYSVSEMLFRRLGEHHRWMYDEFSLGDLLRELGFIEVKRHTHLTSDVPGWREFALDADSSGRQYKGVSLYLEARKPGSDRSAHGT